MILEADKRGIFHFQLTPINDETEKFSLKNLENNYNKISLWQIQSL
ncbi:MAG: hypothetical protein ACRCZW_02830 [Lactobacillaceae bacterium]